MAENKDINKLEDIGGFENKASNLEDMSEFKNKASNLEDIISEEIDDQDKNMMHEEIIGDAEPEDRSRVFYATGKRKHAVARVYMTYGTGRININKKKAEEYFAQDALRFVINQPLSLTNSLALYNFKIRVFGGGLSGQAGAIRHGIAKVLLEINPELKQKLKAAGFLTRDPRMKERKKYGLKGARKAPQFSKR